MREITPKGQEPDVQPLVLSLQQVAAMLGCSRSHIYSQLHEFPNRMDIRGQLPDGTMAKQAKTRIPLSDVHAYLDRRKVSRTAA